LRLSQRHELGRSLTPARHPPRKALLTPFHQVPFALAWFRGRCEIERPGAGFGLSRAATYRYLDEALCVLSYQATSCSKPLEFDAWILDGRSSRGTSAR